MSAPTPPTLKRLVVTVGLYMAMALLAGSVAITRNLPAEFGGSRTGLTASQDFLYGMGTALSPPFYLLPIQAVLLWLTRRNDRRGTFGVVALTVLGVMTCLGALGEPINRTIFNPATFEPLKALLMAAMIFLPVFIMVFGLQEWRRRHKQMNLRHEDV